MEFQGTKGEWSVGDLKISVWAENRKGCIADCSGVHHKDFYSGFEKEEMLANAKLIASAPELLLALKDLVWLVDNHASDDELRESINMRAKQAIAKALHP